MGGIHGCGNEYGSRAGTVESRLELILGLDEGPGKLRLASQGVGELVQGREAEPECENQEA